MSSGVEKVLRPRISLLLPDLCAGGAERININLANEFVARGFSVDMLLVRATGELMPLLDPRVRVVDFSAKRLRGCLRPLTHYLRQTQPSVLLACMWPLTTLAIIARFASGANVRVVVAEHTTWSASEWSTSRFHRLLLSTTMRLAFPCADGVVAVSKGAADDLARIADLPRSRVSVIYNPIVGGAKPAVTSEEPELPEWAIGPHHKILAVGTLKVIKDYSTLLRAFAILRRSTDARLLILGEGIERGPLERLIDDLHIGADVCLPGFVTNTQAYYEKADLYVLSSSGEGLPTVIVEALEHGVPVVSTDCPSGPREILDNGRYGILVPVADPDALARAMLDALSRTHDPDVLKTRAAFFSVDKAADAYLDLLLPDWRQLLSIEADVQWATGILYIAYDGILEPLGQSNVLAYLERLARDRPIHLLSFEKSGTGPIGARDRVQARMDRAGIFWHPRRYHRRPSAVATSWDDSVGIVSGLWLVLRYRLYIVHARSYVAAVMALVLKRLLIRKLQFFKKDLPCSFL